MDIHNQDQNDQNLSPQMDNLNSQDQADNTVQEAQESNSPQDGQLLAGKFKSQEDLIQAYENLEKMASKKNDELAKMKKVFLSDDEVEEEPQDDGNDQLEILKSALEGYFPTREEMESQKKQDAYFNELAPQLASHRDKINEWAQLPSNQGKSFEEVADSYHKTFLKDNPKFQPPAKMGQRSDAEKQWTDQDTIDHYNLGKFGVSGRVQNFKGNLRKI